MFKNCYQKAQVLILAGLILFSTHPAGAWGFFAHKRINRLAVFSLPPEMLTFYKYHINYLTDNAVNPDRRRYAVVDEAPRHYIDLDVYGDSAAYKMPKYWKEAVAIYTEDTLKAYGIVPWHINTMRYRLVEAFKNQDIPRILSLSADIGHYIGDANVPLHTTSNYNGQYTNQYGIHGFWESRLPELFAEGYSYWTRPAELIRDPQAEAWSAVRKANMALDSVLGFEKSLKEQIGEDKAYGFDDRNGITTRSYSQSFSKAYHDALNGQVERRMLASIQMVGDFWYTCWIEAGQPDLNKLLEQKLTEQQKKALENEPIPAGKPLDVRPHESHFMGFQRLMAKN
jgi:hypothetical protein